MIRFKQIAAPAIVSAAMLVGLQGCASADRPDAVPGHAMVISEGRDTISSAAPHDGMIYIADSTNNKLVYSGKVDQGDSVQVDAKKDKVLLNDKVAMETGLNDSDHYKIFFDRSKMPDATTAGHQTIIQPAPAATYNNNYGNTPTNGATVIQPAPSGNGATITQPNGTVVKPDGNVVQPNGTEVKQGENGSTTVVTPAR